MNWKWILGAFLIGFGLSMLVFGVIGKNSANAKLADLIEIIAGLISLIIGFFLVTHNERKDR